MLQQFVRVGSTLLVVSASLYAMERPTLKELATKRVSELVALNPNPSYYVKAFDTLPIELIEHVIQRLILTNKYKSALPIALLSYKLHRQQQQQKNTNQRILCLMLSNNQQVQLTPEQTRELIQNSATIRNLIQDIEEHVEEVPLPLLTQEQVTVLLPYISIINALNTSDSMLPILQQEIPETVVLSSYSIKYTALQQLKEHLTACTVPMLCDLIIAASYLDIQNSEQIINFIELVAYALSDKLLKASEYQNEYGVINTLPAHVQQILVRYLVDNSAVRYALCSNNTDIITNTAQTLTGHRDPVAWLPDGKYIASYSNDKTIRVWDTTINKWIRTFSGHTTLVISIVWSPNGKQIASSGWDNIIRIWDTNTGTCIHELIGHNGWVNTVSWSPDGKYIASGSKDNTIKVWDASIGTCIHTLTGHNESVSSVSWSPDSSKLASGSYDNTIRIWNATTGACIHTLKDHTNSRIMSIAWSPNGNMIASGSWETVKVWNATTYTCIHTLRSHTDWATSVTWLSDGSMIASGSNANIVKIWDIVDKKLDNYLKNTLSWEQTLLLVRIMNAYDSDFTHDTRAQQCYKNLPEKIKQLIEPLRLENAHNALRAAKNLDKLIRANPAQAALFGVGLQVGRTSSLRK